MRNPSESLTRVETPNRRWLAQAEAGQSIVILAIGFIALLGFVGIVTDVSILFVRYSSLRRAVDAAAVAAAGQMRRVPDVLDPGNPTIVLQDGEATSVANLGLAARQIIELYGLNPRTVFVDTCRTQYDIPRDADGNPVFDPVDPVLAAQQRARYAQLCTSDELKLIRVTAQVDSPTVFLRLLGYPTVTLTEAAISQTAVIDVVLIMDVSESMSATTDYEDWETQGFGVRYIPPYIRAGYGFVEPDPAMLGNNPPYTTADDWQIANGQWYVLQTHDLQELRTTQASYFQPVVEYQRAGIPTQNEPRLSCQVRAAPATKLRIYPITPWQQSEFTAQLAMAGYNYNTRFQLAGSTAVDTRFSGFVPTYNYFGCCNDPNGDWLFNDLVCQPFGEIRDATEQFLARLDFIRGDRVSFIAFDRQAYIVDPDGDGPQPSMIETEGPIVTGDVNLDRRGALATLRESVGVRAEPSFYRDLDSNGIWDNLRLIAGPDESDDAHQWTELENDFPTFQFIDHALPNVCPFDNAALWPPYILKDTFLTGTSPNTYRDYANTTSLIDILPSHWYQRGGTGTRRDRQFRSYENRGSCATTNIGTSLRTASSTLYNNGRREGAVWIVVLLSDGAAGMSDPMFRNANSADDPQMAAPYNLSGNFYLPVGGQPSATNPPGYGAYGVCPLGEWADNTAADPPAAEWAEIFRDSELPYCADRYPETRHFCSTLASEPTYMLLDSYPDCVEWYDVDDNARDWADWIGLANLPGTTTSGTSRLSEQQLPTIFTIGFALTFDNYTLASGGTVCASSTDWACLRNAPKNQDEYGGEQLLRYIGDVGDNFRVDDDHQQALMGARIPNNIVDTSVFTDPNWGTRGPCESPTGAAGVYAPLDPKLSCGNYFSATSATALEDVFNQIAGRMFTRLSR